MKSAKDCVKGKIVDCDPERGTVTIIAPYSDWFTMARREYKECLVQMIDSRPLSEKQRRCCYALLKEIAEFTGMGMEETKTHMKLKFIAEDLQETADKIFSLSNASMSLVCQFQAFLIDIILSWDVPTRMPLISMVDDVDRYVYGCLVNKRCCVCGKPAFLHHWDRVGAGRDRLTINHIGLRAEPLCWEHHTECHTMPQQQFDDYYHIRPVKIDKTVAKIYGLNTKVKKNQEEKNA